MNRIFEKYKEENNELFQYLINGKKNVIFGGGVIGRLLFECASNLGIEIECFLVNEGHKKEEQIEGVKVIELPDFILKNEECNIFIGVRSDSYSIIEPLMERGFSNIIHFDYARDICFLLMLYYKDYFTNNNIDISKELIIFNDCKIVNPFLKEIDYSLSWLLEVGDIILPKYMDDYTKIEDGYYEYNEVKLEEGDVVFDCGANIGLFSAIAASENCEVYAFEPIPKTQEYLNLICDLYPMAVHLCPYALADKKGYAKFNVLDNNLAASSMLDMHMNEHDYSINVEMTTIDEFIIENKIEKLDFIKADIEGAERFMLMGAKETLRKFGPKISICTYHLKDDPEVLEKLIKDSNENYVVEHRWKKIYAYIPEN